MQPPTGAFASKGSKRRMTVAEQHDPGNRTVLNVSLDRGLTWQRVPVTDKDAIGDVLRPLG